MAVEMLQNAGRRMLFWGALLLIVWAGYELSTRLDAMSRPLAMYYQMAVGEKIGLSAALKYVDWEILRVPGFLIGCIALGFFAFLGRRKALLALFLIPLCVLTALYTVGASTLFSPDLWSLIKLLPLLLITLGGLINLVLFFVRRSRRSKVRPNTGEGVKRF
jgi:hypothetical protein